MSDTKTPKDDATVRMKRALAAIEALKKRLDAVERARTEPIAIVGMACRFPGGATSPAAFWEMLCDGRDAIVPVPKDRWDGGALYDPDPSAPGKMNSRWGGFIDGADRFDAEFFGVPAREAAAMDPQQRLLLEVTWEALEDAGLVPERMRGSKTGVFFGVCSNDYLHLLAGSTSAEDPYRVTGNAGCFASGRVSYVWDFQGPSVVVDTACSSSLAAAHMACTSLRAGECEVALIGGVNLLLSPVTSILMTKTYALSPEGRCKTFDEGADGFVRGEGCAVIALKRLSDAERDGDRIWAVIRGSAMNQDGRSAGLTAPNALSQKALLRQALAAAGVGAERIGFVETHGTGTALGDPIEVEALRDVVGGVRDHGAPCVLGALKTNVGHLEGAAGIAGLMKLALCVHHGRIPKNLHFKRWNPNIAVDGSALAVPTSLVAWPPIPGARVGGVSSFGMSGTNVHVIVEEAPAAVATAGDAERRARDGAALLILSARSEPALVALAERYARWLDAEGARIDVDDVCAAAALHRAHHAHRLAVTGATAADLRDELHATIAGDRAPANHAEGRPRVVMVFPGQGSQWLGMGLGLFEREPVFRESLLACEEAIRDIAGWSVRDRLGAAASDAESFERVDVVQPLLFAMHVSLARQWEAWGVVPDAFVGHSLGEIAAAHVAGALSLRDAARVVCVRSRLVREASGRGGMMVVELSAGDADAAIAGDPELSVAAINGPSAVVIAGETSALARLQAKLDADGVYCRRVKVDYASHCAEMDPILPRLVAELAGIAPIRGRTALFSTVLCRYVDGAELDVAYWAKNLRAPVRFAPAIDALLREGRTLIVEASPNPSLLVSLDPMLSSAPGAASVGSLRRERPERASMLESLGRLYVHDAPIDWAKVFPGPVRHVDLPTYAWQGRRHWYEAASHPGVWAANGATAEGTAAPAADEVDSGSWLVPTWQESALVANDATRAGAWLIVGGGAIAGPLDAALAAHGARVVRAADAAEAARAIVAWPADSPCHGVVSLAAVDDGGALDDDAGVAMQRAAGDLWESLLLLVQAIARAPLRDPPRLALVTRGAQSVVASDAVPGLAAASLWGFGRTIAHEHPELRCLRIDLDPTAAAPGGAAEAIAREVLADTKEDEVALRGEARLVARLARPRVDAAAAAKLRGDATYLVTGGLGGLGLAAAEWMAREGARHLVLAGRSGAASDEAARAVAVLRDAGVTVWAERADVADRDALAALFARIRAELPPLRGIVHAAGVLDDAMLARQTRARFDAVAAPKIAGAWNLHILTQASSGAELDFFVLYASGASLLGSPAQANYAAANAFLDALAHHRRALGLPAVSIDWGLFADVGLAAAQENRGQRLLARGVRPLSPRAGTETLARLLGAPFAQVGVVPIHPRQWLDAYPQAVDAPRLGVIVAEAQRAGEPRGTPFKDALAGAPADARRAMLEVHVAEKLARVLRVPRREITSATAFGSVSLDSLMALELRNGLETSIGIRLPATLVWRSPTVGELAAHLFERLGFHDEAPSATARAADEGIGGRVAALTEDELDAAVLDALQSIEEIP